MSDDLYARLCSPVPPGQIAVGRETFTRVVETTDADRVYEMLSIGIDA